MHRRSVSRIFSYLKFKSLNVQFIPQKRNQSSIESSISESIFSPSDVSFSVIKNALEKNGYAFEEGFTCLSTRCICGDEENGKIFINKVTGFFICMECQNHGNWDDLHGNIVNLKSNEEIVTANFCKGKFKKSKLICEGSVKWDELTKTHDSLSKLAEPECNEILTTFKFNAFSSIILKEMNVLVDKARKNLYFPLNNGKKQVVGVKQLSIIDKEYCYPNKHCMGLLKFIPTKVKRKCESAVLVQNIRDLIALSSSKINHHIVHLPHGILMLPQEILPILESYKKLILWFGNDAINADAARMFSKKLGDERCFIVRTTHESPSKFIENNENTDIVKMINSAYPMINRSVTTFSELKEDIWSDLTNVDKAEGIKWERFPTLNTLLRGHRRGELTVVTGPTGCGKTTFLSEYSLDLALQGVSTLWGSFEIRNQRLATMMLRQMVRSPLTENLDKFDAWAKEFEKLPIYFLKFHGQQSLGKVMEVVEQARYIYDIQHLIIDNLQFMMGLISSDNFADRFYKQDLAIAAFRSFATLNNCHVTLIIHPKKERETDELAISSIFGGAKASQEADNIMILQNKHMKKCIQLVKNRYSGQLGQMPLNFDKNSLSFAGKNLKGNNPS